jgi:hypothetical protein
MPQPTEITQFIFGQPLSELPDTQMTEGEAQAAFQYLKGKGLIEANFLLRYSARLSAAGHDAIREAENTPDRATHAFPAITYNYYMSVQNMTGSNVQQGTTGSVIRATQTVTTEQLVNGVRNLVEQLDRALTSSDLPTAVQLKAREALTELRAAASAHTPDASRLRQGLQSLKHVMEHATGHMIAAGSLALIAKLLGAG